MKLTKTILLFSYVATNFAVLYTEESLSFVTIVLVVILVSVSSAIHLSVHECGHLVGGLISGYKLVCLQIGPINLVADRSKKLSLSMKNTRGGQCIMLPPKSAVVHYKAYNLGGVYTNVFVSAIGSILLLADSFYVTLFFIQLLFIGLIKIITNLFPHIDHSIPNDGYVVKLLNRDPKIQEDYIAYLSLYAALFWNESVCRDEYSYSRESTKNDEDLFYYNGIQELLGTLETPNE